jgi:hypothetical protein
MRRIVALICTSVLLAAPIAAQTTRQRADRNHVTKDEIAQAGTTVNTAFELIRMLRPMWLSPPRGSISSANLEGGGGGATEVIIYINDLRQQSIEDLKTLKAVNVVDMRYLDQNRAIQLKGPGHEMGVIDVTTADKKS